MTRRLTPYAELADILSRLGPLIADARRARGLSTRAAGRQMGVSCTTILRIEAGEGYDSRTAVAVLRWLDTTAVQPTITDADHRGPSRPARRPRDLNHPGVIPSPTTNPPTPGGQP